MNRKAISFLAVLLLTATAHAESVPWTLDPAHSHVGFTARHLGFSKVSGEFKKFTAKVEADAKTGKITKLEAEADAKSVDTGIEKRDNHLRSDDFFGADQFPQLKIDLKNIKWKSKTAFSATGAMTIRNVTKDVKFEGEQLGMHMVNFGQGPQLRTGYEAHAKINRKDFGLKYAALVESISVVGDEVEITLEAELSLAQPATPAPVAAAAPAAAPAAATAAAKPATPAAAPAATAAAKPVAPAAASPKPAAPAAVAVTKTPTAPAVPAVTAAKPAAATATASSPTPQPATAPAAPVVAKPTAPVVAKPTAPTVAAPAAPTVTATAKPAAPAPAKATTTAAPTAAAKPAAPAAPAVTGTTPAAPTK